LSHAHATVTATVTSMPTLNEDPMQWEVELGHPHLFMGYHSLSKLVLESVGFSVGLLPGQLDRALVVSGPVVDSNSTPPPSLDPASDSPPAFVNTSRRAELAHMIKGVILTIPTSFVCVLSKPVATYALATPPPRRQKKASGLTSLPRRSTWLTKKAFHRSPAVVAAQNLLMKKLGLSNEGQLEAIDFERYLSMFNDGLSE
jgi:hypothetical protein